MAGFLTYFATGALNQLNKNFDETAREQEKLDQITAQRQASVDAEAAKMNADAKKRADLAQSLKAIGINDDKAFAISKIPSALTMNADDLADLANRMDAVPGQMTPATTQTRQIISPGAIQKAPHLFTQPIVQRPITMTTGENQPPRQAYQITSVPQKDLAAFIKQFPAPSTPEQEEAQRQATDAFKTGGIKSVPSATLQLAIAGSAGSEDKLFTQYGKLLSEGYYNNPQEAYRAYIQAGGANQNADFSMFHALPDRDSSGNSGKQIEAKAQMIFDAAKARGQPISMADAKLAALKAIDVGINPQTNEPYLKDVVGMVYSRRPGVDATATPGAPTTPIARDSEGNPIQTGYPILDTAPSIARFNASKVPKMDQVKSEAFLRDNTVNVDVVQHGLDLVNGNPSSVGLTGALKEKGGYLVEGGRAFGWLIGSNVDYGKPIDELVDASTVTHIRNYFKMLEANIARPMLQDRQVSEGERKLVSGIIGALDPHDTLEATQKSLKQLLGFEYTLTARHLMSTPRYAPPDRLGVKGNEQVTNTYGKQLMDMGYSQNAAVEVMRRIIRIQNGHPMTLADE